MAAWYGLWDVESGNNLGFFPTQDAALAVVRQELRAYGHQAVLSLALDCDDAPGGGLVAEGEDLITLAESAELPQQSPSEGMHHDDLAHLSHRARRS
jgi:hypothetical protein